MIEIKILIIILDIKQPHKNNNFHVYNPQKKLMNIIILEIVINILLILNNLFQRLQQFDKVQFKTDHSK